MPWIAPRWLAISVFTLYSAVNYLDRQTLAALAPEVKAEFQLTNEDYGWLQSAFYLVYALLAPLVGLWIDRVGLTRGATLTIGLWSAAAVATGFTRTFGELLACRILLGAAESGGIPAFAKASATYLEPRERALGAGVNQLGISLGSMGAPLVAGIVAARYGWRTAFIVAGLAGLLWIPLWRAIRRRATPLDLESLDGRRASALDVARDSRLWALVGANILVMTVYSLWTNWTTLFLVDHHHLSQLDANRRFAWIPPVFATCGGLFGGWLSMRWIAGGIPVIGARTRGVLVSAAALLLTALAPLAPAPAAATALISLSFFWSVAASSNLYALPQDLFGAERAAFAVSAITFGFGLMQTLYSPLVGRLADRYGFTPVCVLSAVLPLAGWLVLRLALLAQKETQL